MKGGVWRCVVVVVVVAVVAVVYGGGGLEHSPGEDGTVVLVVGWGWRVDGGGG